ncbi:hypothetical protein H5410_032878 [Solanum commersonii]|uniref:DUF4283 domain-containing protein n=1 Tax=Solanum commersonii TaxID=4109 RepID=A0A9J5YQX1_SOLCO|nr:hypothetical protein H5410_032878 [Solanum commersonii]
MKLKKSLLSFASAVGKPVALDKATKKRTRPSTARVKVILDILDKHPKKIKVFFVDKDSGKVIEHYQEFVYDNLPRYCIHCKRQGHDENSCRVFLGKVGVKNQNDATDKGTAVEQYQGDAKEIINAKFQSKSNKEEHRQLVFDDNFGEGRDSRNNLGVVRDATVDRAFVNSFEEATTFNSNNEENLEIKGKSIEAARLGVGKDGVLGSPNVVAAKQDNFIAENSNNEWTLVSHKKKEGVSKSSNNQILHQQNSTEVELDRSNIVIKCTQFNVSRDENIGQQERIHGTDELSTEFGSTLGKSEHVTGVLQHTQNSAQFDKDINNLGLVPRDLNKNREHVDQQVVLTHENEFIVIEEIVGKEISPNTPIMVVSDPEKATSDLNVPKEKQKETSASKWADLVKEEENITSPPMSKLIPQAPEFVPTSKANPSMTMTVDSFKKSLAMNTKDIKVLAKSHDPEVIVSGNSPTAAYDTDLGTDMSDGDDEEEMFDICFDKVAKEGDLSPRQQRSVEATK